VDAIIQALSEQHHELDTLLGGLGDEEWARASRCPGWTVADVVLHLAQTDELVVASVEGRYGDAVALVATRAGGQEIATVDDAAEVMVARERGEPGSAVLARWREAAAAEGSLLAACDPGDRLAWVSGDLPARTLATTRLSETWIHTGDVADALGVTLAPTDRLWHVARLAWRTLPYAFQRAGRELAGPVAAELTAPDGAPWAFGMDDGPSTIVRGAAEQFCLVAGRRLGPAHTALVAEGADATGVLELLRTYA